MLTYKKRHRKSYESQLDKKIWEREYLDNASVRVNTYCRELNKSVELDDKEKQLRELERDCKKIKSIEPTSRQMIANAKLIVYDQLAALEKQNDLTKSQMRCEMESKSLLEELEGKDKQ